MTARYRLIWMLALVFFVWLAAASLGRAQSILYPSTTDTLLSIGSPIAPAPVVVVTPPPTIVVAPSTSSSSPSTTTICTTAGSITYCTH